MSSSAFSFGNRVGVLLLVETSVVSASAILLLLLYIAYSAVTITRGSSRRWRIEGAAEVYFLNQLTWDLLQACGGIMNIKWALDASVHPGSFCTAQGAVKQASDVGCALSTLIIATFTIVTLCFSKQVDPGNGHVGQEDDNNARRRGLRWGLGIVTVQWIAVGILVAGNIIVDGANHFYGPSGLWCWIQSHYSVKYTVFDFGIMWITAVFIIVIYAILFLYLRGYITTDRWRISVSRRPEPLNIIGPRKLAYGLLFYPLIYTFAILPLSVVRYSGFAHHHIPHSVTFFVDCIYLSNGLFNVLLFSITRPFLLPHDSSSPNAASEVLHDTSPPQINGPVDHRAYIDTMQLPRHESPAKYPGLLPAGGPEGGEIMRWSPAMSQGTSGVSPSVLSIGR